MGQTLPLEKPIVAQLVKKFTTFYGILKFFTIFLSLMNSGHTGLL
jgi:hypothetical protein